MGSLKRKKKTSHTDLVVQQKDHLALEIEESLREWKPYLWKFFVVSKLMVIIVVPSTHIYVCCDHCVDHVITCFDHVITVLLM